MGETLPDFAGNPQGYHQWMRETPNPKMPLPDKLLMIVGIVTLASAMPSFWSQVESFQRSEQAKARALEQTAGLMASGKLTADQIVQAAQSVLGGKITPRQRDDVTSRMAQFALCQSRLDQIRKLGRDLKTPPSCQRELNTLIHAVLDASPIAFTPAINDTAPTPTPTANRLGFQSAKAKAAATASPMPGPRK